MPNTSASGGYLIPTSAAPAEDDALDDIFQAMIVGLTGIAPNLVRPRWQPTVAKQPEPNVNWCAIGVIDETPDANAYVAHVGTGDGHDDLQRHEAIKVLATFYGPNAKSYAKMARDGLSIPQNSEALKLELLAFITTDIIRAVPEQINNGWVRRYDLPLHFRRLIKRSYAIQNILIGDVTVQADDLTESIIVTQ